MIITTKNEQETSLNAENFAKSLSVGDVILLHGNLGAGKSVFARAVIRGLMDDSNLEVPSPTFTLVQTYETTRGPLWHFDLYRLKEAEEIYELGWEEALGESIMIIEWPERLGALKPSHHIDIHIDIDENDAETRTIQIEHK